MKQLALNNQTFNIPESWNDITIQMQLNVEAYNKEYPDLSIVCILAGYLNLSIDDVKKLHINTISDLINEFNFIQTPPLKTQPVSKFTHDGFEYDVVPTLLDAQFQDFISLETLREQYKDNLYNALPLIIAILAKREGETLDSFDIVERSKCFYDLPITIANSLYSFFLSSAMLYNQDLEVLLQVENQKLLELIKSIKNTAKKQGGKGLSSRLHKVTLLKYVTFIENHWNKYFSGYNSKQENQN